MTPYPSGCGHCRFQSVPVDVNCRLNAAVRPLLISMEFSILFYKSAGRNGHSGDSGWLSEAIQNILKNCVQSAGDNGEIKIVCEDTCCLVRSLSMTVEQALKKERFARLFERFYRGKNEDAVGYGIGLALCKMIITRQGGTITAKNHPQGGAVFLHSFSKVTNLSLKSHRNVSWKFYYMGEFKAGLEHFRKRRLT